MSCPSDIRASINVSSTVLVNWTEPVALDNGDLAPQVTAVPPGIRPPHNFNKTTLVVYTARDASGNKKECSFKVVLEGECELDFATCIWGNYARLVSELFLVVPTLWLTLRLSKRLGNCSPALCPLPKILPQSKSEDGSLSTPFPLSLCGVRNAKMAGRALSM